jgi:hypothetical protein
LMMCIYLCFFLVLIDKGWRANTASFWLSVYFLSLYRLAPYTALFAKVRLGQGILKEEVSLYH